MRNDTCGELYLDSINTHGYGQPGDRAFAAGFMCGQAEKVLLGACKAAMFRPSKPRWGWAHALLSAIVERYGLCLMIDSAEGEMWIYRGATPGWGIGEWKSHVRNSADWHKLRGYAVGIPPEEIDTEYHLRKTYGCQVDGRRASRK